MFPIRLREKDIYGHLRFMRGEPVRMYIPALGARYILDLAYALRKGGPQHNALATSSVSLAASLFGLETPPGVLAHINIMENGLCSLEIRRQGSGWRKEFWPDMTEITSLGAALPSKLVPDWSEVGNLKFSIVNISGKCDFLDDTMSFPVLSVEDMTTIASGIIPWTGVDPLCDGRLGVEGYITGGTSLSKPLCMDIFPPPSKDTTGLAFIYELTDSKGFLTLAAVAEEAAMKVNEEARNHIFRALADIEISYKNFEPAKRSFHEEHHITKDDAIACLKAIGVKASWNGNHIDARWEGIRIESCLYSDDLAGSICAKAMAVRLVENLAQPLRQRPFLHRRHVIFQAPLDILKNFTPQTVSWENRLEENTRLNAGLR